MITAFFIFNRKGEVIISKLVRDNIRHNIADVFRIQVITSTEVRSPVLTLGSTTFLHVRFDGLWFVAVTRSNQDVSIIFEFIYKLRGILETTLCTGNARKSSITSHSDLLNVNDIAKNVNNYLNVVNTLGILTEDDITNNFTQVYEIIDQVLEFGYPQNMELSVVLSLLSTPIGNSGNASTSLIGKVVSNNSNNNSLAHLLRSPDIKRHNSATNDSLRTPQVDGEVIYRRSGIKYRKNQIYLDVHEEINVLMTASGTILKSYVDGHIQMKTKLSGMPVCKFGLNDSLIVSETEGKDFLKEYDVKNPNAIPQAAAGAAILEDCKFHQCVELDKFDSDRLIHFVPPDGDFELMKYRATENVNLPFIVLPKIQEAGKSLMNFNVLIRSLFPPKLIATNVLLKIPVPPGSIKANLETTGGKAKFAPEENAIIWRFNKFNGQIESTLQGFVTIVPGSVTATTDKVLSPTLNDVRSPIMPQNVLGWSKPPIILSFNLESFSCSGLVVRYLKVVEKSNYSTVKWVRYISKAGTYEVRY